MLPRSTTLQGKAGDDNRLQPKLAILKTLEQLKRQFPDLEIGDGSGAFRVSETNGKELAQKISTPERAPKKTTPKLKPPKSVQRQREALKKVKDEESKSPVKVKLSPTKNGRTSERVAKAKASESLRQIAIKTDEFKIQPKPGTAGSRTEIGPKSKTSKTKRDKEKLALFSTVQSFNTNCIVDDTILAFAAEIAQRADLDYIPRDPKKLCKSFTLELTELGLYPTETCHTQEEIEEWGSRYEGLYC